MALIDNTLREKHAAEERRLRFTSFVQREKALNSPGMARAGLLSEGYRDYYGEVHFGYGMHQSRWILPMDKNPRVLLYPTRKEAKIYAETLQKILRENGYPFSKTWVEPVAVRNAVNHPYSQLIPPTITFDPEDRYIIMMKVR